MNKTTIPIKGMHCRSCELLIEDELKTVAGVEKADVSQKKGCAVVYYEGRNPNNEDMCEAIERAGYQVGIEEAKPLISKNINDYIDVIVSVVALFLLFILVDMFGLNKLVSTSVSRPSGLVPIFLVGITAGLSTCMALVGGLILGVSARFSEKHPDATVYEKFKPHLFFNAGRIASYVIFGGTIGTIGSFFQISGYSLGLLTLGVALVMLMLGLQLTGLFPRISNARFTLPTGISRALGIKEQQNKEYSHKNTMILGGLTFFLPCGFTQAMQLLAMSSGSFARGAAIMGIFALGTVPGLLGVGGLTSAITGYFAQKFFKFAGVVVIILAFFNAQNGLNLMGLSPTYLFSAGNAVAVANANNIVDGVQVVKMTQSGSGYSPNIFTVVKDIPVKWEINSTDSNTCASTIIISRLGIRKTLEFGDNTIEFTPTDIGKLPFSCSMGMYTGFFNVIEKGSDTTAVQQAAIVQSPPANTGASCGGGGCGCGGGKNTFNTNDPRVTPQQANDESDVQILKTTYTQGGDIQPNTFTVKSSKKVRMEIDVKDNGSGCMSTITIPRLVADPQFLAKGKTIVFEFTPSSTGDYPITCAMGVPRGVIKVI
jgi:sulfite exporter TauE/SafE/copper chaperone CopZ